MLDFIREGDLVVVHSLDRLARALDDPRAFVPIVDAKGVQIDAKVCESSYSGDHQGRARSPFGA